VKASYTKLKSGDWGVRVVGEKPDVGATITVTKKDGTTKSATVEKVVWSDADGRTHLVAVRPSGNGSTTAASRSGRNVCAECGKGGTLVSDLEDGLMKHYRCCDIPPGGY
jgi:hypothetical protein